MLEKEGEKMHCVLIVEDDSDINNFINDYFVIKGYSTIQAFSGTEGLLRLKSEKNICCVILDLMLPGISGEEIIQEIRKVSDVPIITVSAKNEEEAKIEVLKLGADDFLLKPFNLEELQLKVERNIQKYLNQQVSYKKNEEFKKYIEEIKNIEPVIPSEVSDILRGYQKDGMAWLSQLS